VLIGARPAFRLVREVEIELLPGLVVDLFDVAVLVLQLDELRVLVHGKDLEDLFVVEALVPLARHGVVIAAHGLPRSRTPNGCRPASTDITGAGRCQANRTVNARFRPDPALKPAAGDPIQHAKPARAEGDTNMTLIRFEPMRELDGLFARY